MAAAVPMALGGMKAAGAIMQGKMTSQSLNAQADMNERNAKEAEAKGQYDAMRQQLMAGRAMGASIAAYGASGVTNTGSVLEVLHTSSMNAELDRLNILHGADVRAINFQNQAAIDRYGAKSALKAGYWNALGSMAGSAMTAASMSTGATPATSAQGSALSAGGMDSGYSQQPGANGLTSGVYE